MTSDPAPAQEVECRGVHGTATRLMEVEGGRVMVLIPLNEVTRLVLRYGVQAPHPVPQIIVGGALLAIGYVPARLIFRWLTSGGILFHAAVAYLLWAPLIGLYVIFTALKRGFYLEAETRGERKRVAFARRSRQEEIRAFAAQLEAVSGLKVIDESARLTHA